MSDTQRRVQLFVAGTDTGVGKTLVACALLRAGQARGWRCIGLKPVASGSLRVSEGLRNGDALALQAAMSEPLDYPEVNPVALEPAIAPHLAAAAAGLELTVEGLAMHCRQVLARHAHELAVIEGAGGWRVPLGPRETLADLARALQLPVLLVVGLRLGCVNHALLSAEAIRHDGLRLAGWVASQVDPDMPCIEENLATLRERLGAPRLGWIPHRAGIEARDAAHGLDLDALIAALG
jgi:dethiobiotin synthetase